MRLFINNLNKKNLDYFIEDSVIPEAIEIFYSLFKPKDLIKIQDYLSKLYDKPIKLNSILQLAIRTLTYRKLSGNYIIQIDSNKILKEIPAKLYDICSLVNYGNLEIQPYPIFSRVMDILAKRLPQLYREYY